MNTKQHSHHTTRYFTNQYAKVYDDVTTQKPFALILNDVRDKRIY